MNSTNPEQIEANSPEGAADNQTVIETQAKLTAELGNLNDQPQQEIADRKEMEQELHSVRLQKLWDRSVARNKRGFRHRLQ